MHSSSLRRRLANAAVMAAMASLFGLTIAAAPMTAASRPSTGSLPVGNIAEYTSDCLYGPFTFGEIGFGTALPPAMVASQKCVSINLWVDPASSGVSNANVSITLPKGISVTKKIAAPSNASYFGTFDCYWGGSYGIQSANGAQTIVVKGVSCDAGGYLSAFFAATISVPSTLSYLPYTGDSINAVNNQFQQCLYDTEGDYSYCGFQAYATIFGNSLLLSEYCGSLIGYFNSGYYTVGSQKFQIANNPGLEGPYPAVFEVAPDNGYYQWQVWAYTNYLFDGPGGPNPCRI